MVVYTVKHPEPILDDTTGIQIKHLRPIFQIGNAPLLPSLLNIRDVDIIHLHWPFIFGAELTWLAAKLRHIPFVLTNHNDLATHGFRQHLFNIYLAISTRLVVPHAAKYCTVSMSHAEDCQLTPFFKKRWSDVVEVPNGVDTDIFHPDIDGSPIRQQYKIPEDSSVFAFVGALDRAHPLKGVDRLIQAFKSVCQNNTARLMIIGGGDMTETYQKMASELDIDDKVIFTGKIPHKELGQYYAACDVLVLPSLLESFGIVLIEAGACGKPVIASNVSGMRSVVKDKLDGFLIKPGDQSELIEKMIYLAQNPTIREEMGKANYKKTIAQYSWPIVVEKLEGIYQQVIHEHHTS